MDTINSGFTLVASILGLIVLGSSVALFVLGSYNKERIKALREDNDDLRDRLNDVDQELVRAKQREDILEEKYNSLKSENEILREMITQRANVQEMTDMLVKHHRAAVSAWNKTNTLLEKILDDQS